MTLLRIVPGIVLALFVVQIASAQSTLTGVVRDGANGLPIPNAAIRVLPTGLGDPMTVLTGSGGVFRVTFPGPGRYSIRAEALGFSPSRTETFEIGGAQSLTFDIVLTRAPVVLEGVVSDAEAAANREGFERRSRLSYGTRLDADFLAQRGDMSLNEFVARNTPWLTYSVGKGACMNLPVVAYGPRLGSRPKVSSDPLDPCTPPEVRRDGRLNRGTVPVVRPLLIVDGKLLNLPVWEPIDIDRWTDPARVEAVEVYPDSQTLPAPFYGLAQAEAGILWQTRPVLVVWTRKGFGIPD